MDHSQDHMANYSSRDFERYYSGQMTPEERHALEKAALDDPFLADALEGYAFAKTPAKDMGLLQERLHARVQPPRSRLAAIASAGWLRIAALLVILLGSGWLVFRLTLPKHDLAKGPANTSPTPLSKQADTSVALSRPAPAVKDHQATDSPEGRGTNIATKRLRPQHEKTQELQAPGAPDVTTHETATTVTNIAQPAYGPAANPSLVASPQAKKTFAAEARKATSEQYNAPPVAQVNESANQDVAQGKITDTVKNLSISLRRLPDTGSNKPVVLEHGKPKQSRYKPLVILDTLEPADGWRSYDDYVASNLKTPEDLKIKPVSGAVELSFEVNEQGEPVNIRVERSLCEQCDREAIRILKTGPRWKKDRNKKGRIAFRF